MKTEQFNPINELLVGKIPAPPQLGELNLRVLTPYRCTLMVIDETITKFIEDNAMELIKVSKLS